MSGRYMFVLWLMIAAVLVGGLMGCVSAEIPGDPEAPTENSGEVQENDITLDSPADSETVDPDAQGPQDREPESEGNPPEEHPDEAEPEDTRNYISGKLLHYFQTEYFSAEKPLTANRFLASEYDRPEQVNLNLLFYNGIVENNPSMSEKEEQYVRAILSMEFDVHKMLSDDVDAFLQEYIGLTLAQTDGIGIEGLAYLSEYDAYYVQCSDVPPMWLVSVTAGYYGENGDIILEYHEYDPWSSHPANTTGIVRLTPTETGYVIRENHYTD